MTETYHERFLREKEKQELAKVRKKQAKKEQREAKAKERILTKEIRKGVKKELKRKSGKKIRSKRKGRFPQIKEFPPFRLPKKRKQTKKLSRSSRIRLF